MNIATSVEKETPLHLVASYCPNPTESDAAQGMARIAELLLKHSASTNAKDASEWLGLV